MKTSARWILLIAWTLLLIFTSPFWNPFTSFPALLKYSIVSVIAAAIFGALVMMIQYYLIISIIFPLPPRADSKAPKSKLKKFFPFLYKAIPINPKAPAVLNELVGNNEAKTEIKEVIDMLSNPDHYVTTGATVPKGMLFVGPPGVGKTLFARAIANEVGIPFYVLDGSSLSGLIFGLGVLKLKTIFSKLRKHDKAILFIDEIDSIGSRRTSDRGFGAVSDMNMTLNCLLTEMDGFHNNGILFVGATNNDGILDPALLRAGRMDRRIYFQLPSPEDRVDLFKYYLKKVSYDENINLSELSTQTSNYSPAQIANIVNESALISLRPGSSGRINTNIVLQAIQRLSVGMERTMVGSGVEIANHDASIRLNDVVGIDDVKQDVLEIIEFLRQGDKLKAIGAIVPKGLMLIGPPGVGKTMLAKAIANEAGVPFYGLSASYFQSMFLGEGAARIKALYAQARKSPASIVFIDEIDALGGTVTETGNNRNSALNQILIELDGLERSNVITIGATNMEQNLDPAFMRSGRFDRKAYVGLPDYEGRLKLYQKYLKNIKVKGVIDSAKLAKISANFSGADVFAACNEAAIIAVRKGKDEVENNDLEDACERVSITAGHKLNVGGMNLAKVPDVDVKLNDVKGMDEAISEAQEVVTLLKNLDKISNVGLKVPKGLLLVGMPGVGKTMLAKAIANEAGVPFYALSGSDFQSMWAGVGSNRVRAVYEQARRSLKPSIVFIDEIDAIGARRGEDLGGGSIADANKTLNQLLAEIDGFGKHKVLTIGATNNIEILDNALLRPGRFDRQINVPLPNLEGRIAIINHYLGKVQTESNISSIDLARATVFSSGADLANIINEAGLFAIRDNRNAINQIDLIKATQRVTFGMSYSRQVLLDELTATAYHEAGHALVCYHRNRKDRIQLITIVPSGPALGYVWHVGKDDYVQKTKEDYLVDIEVGFGGYVAESIFMNTTTSGVSSDLDNIAKTARSMVRAWGMGGFPFNVDTAYGGDTNFNSVKISSNTEEKIETAIKSIIDQCKANTEQLLHKNRCELDNLAKALLEKETLYYSDIVAILEPNRNPSEVKAELESLGERKLVGASLKINNDNGKIINNPLSES